MTVPADTSPTGRTGLLSGLNVLIAGTGPNIGRALALEMGMAGADLTLTDVVEPELREREQELGGEGIPTRVFRCDVTREEEVDALFRALDEEGVRIDTLISNVGIDPPGYLLDDFDLPSWTDTYLTNVVGPVKLAREVARRLVDHRPLSEEVGAGGSIVFVTSIHQWTPRGHPTYSASKAALGMVIKELALELAPHGIRVNGIAPGYVRQDDAGAPIRHARTPLGGVSVLPQYVGRAAVYLSSDHFSRHTTGTVLTVDGGLSLFNHLSAGPPPRPAGGNE